MANLAIPTVHLNGTSKVELTSQVLNAYTSCLEALKVVNSAAPHSRDYYVQKNGAPYGGEAFRLANEQHCDRVAMLEAILREYEEIYQGIPL